MKRTVLSAVVGGFLASGGATGAQVLGLGEVGPSCQQHFIASQTTSGDAPVAITNASAAPVFVSWINFAGQAVVLELLEPGHTFNDLSKPQHVYVVMDGNLNCLGGVRLGLVGDHFYVQ